MLQSHPVRQRRPRFLSAGALRVLLALLDPRRSLHAQALFRRPAGAGSRTHAWLPRPWFMRQACLTTRLRYQTLRVYRGRRWRRLLVQRWNIGFAAGSFARTQALAIFKKKASTKKRKKRGNVTVGPVADFRIQRIKDTKAGLRRRSSVVIDSHVETQLRGLA